MDMYTKRIENIDDSSKLYAELKRLNRLIDSDSKESEEMKQKKKLVEDRLNQLMFFSFV